MTPLSSINRMSTARRLPNRQRVVAIGLSAVAAVVFAACGESAADEGADATSAADLPYGIVDVATAHDLASNPDIVVVDVRTPAEYAEGHLTGATLIDYNAPDFAARVNELDSAATYLVYCRSGARSANATATMRSVGIDRIYDLDGGILAWSAAGFDVTTTD